MKVNYISTNKNNCLIMYRSWVATEQGGQNFVKTNAWFETLKETL